MVAEKEMNEVSRNRRSEIELRRVHNDYIKE